MDRQQALSLYRQMMLIRRFEERCAQLYVEGKIGGFLHLYIGQEAVGVGAISQMRPEDYLIAYYRDHGYALARGADPRLLLAELCGKVTGISRGKGGSMHFYDVSAGNFGGDGIVGGHLPLAAGMGYGIRLRGTDQVCLCFFGDGAVNEGAFHEALNVSALWDLPVVYIIENNRYGMGTSIDRSSSVKDLYQRASAYGVPRRDVNGMDLLAVRNVMGEAIERARKEKRPTLIEAETYRYRGHSMSDPGKYRTREEVEQMMKSDPILLFGRRLIEQERFTQADLDAVDKDVLGQMDDAVTFTERSPEPPVESLYEDVYVRSPYIHMKAAEKDPAWRAAVREDRVPEPLPPWRASAEAPPEPKAAPEAGAEAGAAAPAGKAK
ncbi:MAG TPA: pyruvate dehydrogenase (acetyl-transferring) E1 component subunit alpha [Vicinamibacteria bacterium]|nr:pyruvate dehydrogenase (acetyl-transferring) E1 component subunit alpha [Vicinamibacteria bacterium]